LIVVLYCTAAVLVGIFGMKAVVSSFVKLGLKDKLSMDAYTAVLVFVAINSFLAMQAPIAVLILNVMTSKAAISEIAVVLGEAFLAFNVFFAAVVAVHWSVAAIKKARAESGGKWFFGGDGWVRSSLGYSTDRPR